MVDETCIMKLNTYCRLIEKGMEEEETREKK